MTTDELGTVLRTFVSAYTTPPSNLKVQARHECVERYQMLKAEVEKIWRTTLKPKSERWWDLYEPFSDMERLEKRHKPHHTDPTLNHAKVSK